MNSSSNQIDNKKIRLKKNEERQSNVERLLFDKSSQPYREKRKSSNDIMNVFISKNDVPTKPDFLQIKHNNYMLINQNRHHDHFPSGYDLFSNSNSQFPQFQYGYPSISSEVEQFVRGGKIVIHIKYYHA